MRALALSSLVALIVLFAADSARAQNGVFIPNTFAESGTNLEFGPRFNPVREPEHITAFDDEPDYRDSGMNMLRSGSTVSLPLGDTTLISQSSSHYPVANLKLRYRSLFLADRINDHLVVMAGVWEYRLRTEATQTLKTEPTFGLQLAFTPYR